MIELPENIDELHQIRRELKEEEELLSRMVFKIEKQLHALEIEKMHLINSARREIEAKETEETAAMQVKELKSNNSPEENNADEPNLDIDLNLNISSVYQYYDEEEDSEDEEECDEFM